MLGTESLKKSLKVWCKELKKNNLIDRLDDPSVQEECVDKLKQQIDNLAREEDTTSLFVDWVRDTLL